MGAALGSPQQNTGCRPVALARATRAPSLWQRWYCGPCRWGSRSAHGARAGGRGCRNAFIQAANTAVRAAVSRGPLFVNTAVLLLLSSHFRLRYFGGISDHV
ncbi:hypothetical protein ZWY2020_030745 [Hordeum vulgare]|nr:hypothetical protein ZWY2020_030745 [Hordeum vulgare]